MSFIDSAAYWSKVNGFDYFEEGRVLEIIKINDDEYHAKVKGSKDNVYNIVYYPDYPKKSTCDCPRANGKRVVCKHKVAVFYALNPDEAQSVRDEREENLRYQEKLEQEFEERHRKRVEEAQKYVDGLSVEEMKRIIIGYRVSEMEEFEEQFYEDPEEYDYWK